MLSSLFSAKAPARKVSADSCRESLKAQRYGDKTFFYQGQGIGIILDEESSGHKRVKRVLPGSAAARNGTIRIGDRVHEINGQEVWTLDIKACSRLVSSAGKYVVFTLSRRPGNASSRSSISSASPASQFACSPGMTGMKPATATGIVEAPKQPKVACLIDFSPPSSPIADLSLDGSKRLSLEDEINIPNVGRQRSDSEASDSRTQIDIADMPVSEDGRIHFTVQLERGQIEEEGEDVLLNMYYTKGRLSYLRGNSAISGTGSSYFERRWIAIRRGRLLVCKGHQSIITKSIDLSRCTVGKDVVQSVPGYGPCEYFIGIKREGEGKPTLYFGDKDRSKVEKLIRTIEEVIEQYKMEEDHQTSVPVQTRHSMPEDRDYRTVVSVRH